MDFLPTDGLDIVSDHAEAPTGIVGSWLDGLPEWPDEHRTVERAYLGTLMGWKPDFAKPAIQVPDEWLSAFGVAARNTLREARPWPDFPSLYLIRVLREQFKPEYVVDEIAAYCSSGLPWHALDEVAERLRVVEGKRGKLERAALRRRVVEEMLTVCHDSEAIAELCKQLAALG